MKKIIYQNSEGGLSVVTPNEGARLAYRITLSDGTVLPERDDPDPIRVDHINRGWPIAGAVADWAETEDEFLSRIAAKHVPADATGVQFVDASAIPSDRTFRNAWVAGTSRVNHDMAKCREIHKNNLRALRAPKLAALDIEYQRADEAGDAVGKQRIASRKKALRDVTADQRIAAATTPDQLKAVIPEVLK